MVKSVKVARWKHSLLRLSVSVCAVGLSLVGCGQDYSLSPPVDSEKITVTVKLPKELKTETMWVMYRSAKCKRVSRGASGQRTERDGYHSIDREFERQGQSDLYRIELPKDGGGACKWHLANVTFGVVYADPTRFGEDVTAGAGGGVIVIFDHNNSPRGGADRTVDGDLIISKDFYPWLNESFLGGYRKRISLAGEGGIYLSYKALQTREVYFEPILHSGYMVRSEGAKVHRVGSFLKFFYPDGSAVADGRPKPDFMKMQSIRLAAEGKK